MKHLSLDQVQWVIFDLETTGLSPGQGDRIVEIAALKVKRGKVLGEFQSLVNPERAIPYGAHHIHGISEEMVWDAPLIETVLPRFLTFAEGSILVAYNAGFDLSFLQAELTKQGQTFPEELPVVDALMLARRLLPEMKQFSLVRVAEYLEIPFPRQHRALADVQVTAKIFQYFLSRLAKDGVKEAGELFCTQI